MAGLILPRRFTSQPDYPAPVDWGHPSTAGLVSFIYPTKSSILYDATGFSLLADPYNPGDCSFRYTGFKKEGRWRNTGGGSYRNRFDGPAGAGRESPNDQYTAIQFFRPLALVSTYNIMTHFSAANSWVLGDIGIGGTSAANKIVGGDSGTDSLRRVVADNEYVVGKYYSAIYSADYRAGEQILYVDGVAQSGRGTNTSASGRLFNTVSCWANRAVLEFYGATFHLRLMGEAERNSLSQNPWQMLLCPQRKYWAVGGGTPPVDPIHDLSGQNSKQVNTVSTSAVTQTHALAGMASQQANLTTVGSISQVHLIAGSSSQQVNLSIVGNVSQAHVLAGSNSRQVNTTSAGSVSQARLLTGANSQQINTASVGAISQAHLLAGDNSQQINIGTNGAVTQVAPEAGVNNLTGANSQQLNAGSVGVISQIHVLSGRNAYQANAGATGAVTQVHALTGANSLQLNIVVSGAINRTNIFSGANSLQINIGTSGAVTSGESTIIKPNKKLIIAGKQRLRTYVGAGRVRSVVG